jgi:hypothetical protein
MRSRWGSYSRRGVIASTVFLAFLPRDLCEYIVVHELCHSIVFSHSPAFWELVEHAIPDYKERIQRLKQYAYVLNYFPKKK